ncbi:MAG: DNA polymerase III subunit chi [Pseudomonadota bacterium]|nr:DNA polymerase III subunit chi [Pseudomonadota bacterium]
MLVDFYQLSGTPIERVLPSICEKVLTSGGRLLVVAAEPLLSTLDAGLWSYAPDSFLPHGRSDGPKPEAQPVLLSPEAEPANGARNIALADGRWRDEALGFERAFYFFDASSLEEARGQWRKLRARPEAELRYWKKDERGRWVQGP